MNCKDKDKCKQTICKRKGKYKMKILYDRHKNLLTQINKQVKYIQGKKGKPNEQTISTKSQSKVIKQESYTKGVKKDRTYFNILQEVLLILIALDN